MLSVMPDKDKVISGLLSVYGVMPNQLFSDTLALLREQSGWISVKDRLPEQGKTVLVARKYVQPGHKERRYVETAELIGTSWVSIEDEYKMHRQFHTLPYAWMPLPEPPKEEHDEP